MIKTAAVGSRASEDVRIDPVTDDVFRQHTDTTATPGHRCLARLLEAALYDCRFVSLELDTLIIYYPSDRARGFLRVVHRLHKDRLIRDNGGGCSDLLRTWKHNMIDEAILLL
ncbi:hypothetical protein DTO271G3_8312 [Paecilomyces variotii]|nr:hypothetical protein DTO271G3_8312 [Paecilomyces variotii]